MGAVAGSATAGSGNAGTSAGGAGSGDLYASNVAVAVHEEVATVLVVTWNQKLPADETLVEFTFEDGVIMRSRAKPGATGMHRDVVLGVPASSPVTIRVVSPMRARAERYLFGGVENSSVTARVAASEKSLKIRRPSST